MKKQFVFLYRPARADFAEGRTGRETAAVERHFAYLQGLLEAGALKLAGRCEDMSLGLALLECDSEEEARQVLESDPAVRDGVFLASVKAWRTALVVEKW